MMYTKKELIKQYQAGELHVNAIYSTSAFDGYSLIEWTDEFVFGFYQYMDMPEKFFMVKVNILNDDISFKVGKHGRTIKGSECMRIR